MPETVLNETKTNGNIEEMEVENAEETEDKLLLNSNSDYTWYVDSRN